MKIWRQKLSIIQLQLLIWIAVLLLIFFSLLPMDGLKKSVIYTVVNVASYAIIIYGNILFLFPVFYQKRRFVLYGMLVVFFLIITGMPKGYGGINIEKHFLIKTPPIDLLTLLAYVPGGILIYVLSLVFSIA